MLAEFQVHWRSVWIMLDLYVGIKALYCQIRRRFRLKAPWGKRRGLGPESLASPGGFTNHSAIGTKTWEGPLRGLALRYMCTVHTHPLCRVHPYSSTEQSQGQKQPDRLLENDQLGSEWGTEIYPRGYESGSEPHGARC